MVEKKDKISHDDITINTGWLEQRRKRCQIGKHLELMESRAPG